MVQANLKRLFASEGPKVGHAIFEFDTPGIGAIRLVFRILHFAPDGRKKDSPQRHREPERRFTTKAPKN